MELLKFLESKDKKVIKFLQRTKDNHIIETGYYNLDEHIICISSQIGCSMGCIFCATTKPINSLNSEQSFFRNLTSEEIIQQVNNILFFLQKKNKLGTKKILFSYMGMGEPFLNYDNVVKSIKTLVKLFPNSRTTVSSLGNWSDLIKKLAHEKISTVLKLHLSLHAPNDELRRKILPKTQKIQPALEALKYFSLAKKLSMKVNYLLIKDLNDSRENALQLVELLSPYPFVVKLSNLNNFNNELESSNENKFILFEKILNSRGIKTCRFISSGIDINAGCGQLRASYYNKNNI